MLSDGFWMPDQVRHDELRAVLFMQLIVSSQNSTTPKVELLLNGSLQDVAFHVRLVIDF